jgi:hypothetical protein
VYSQVEQEERRTTGPFESEVPATSSGFSAHAAATVLVQAAADAKAAESKAQAEAEAQEKTQADAEAMAKAKAEAEAAEDKAKAKAEAEAAEEKAKAEAADADADGTEPQPDNAEVLAAMNTIGQFLDGTESNRESAKLQQAARIESLKEESQSWMEALHASVASQRETDANFEAKFREAATAKAAFDDARTAAISQMVLEMLANLYGPLEPSSYEAHTALIGVQADEISTLREALATVQAAVKEASAAVLAVSALKEEGLATTKKDIAIRLQEVSELVKKNQKETEDSKDVLKKLKSGMQKLVQQIGGT